MMQFEDEASLGITVHRTMVPLHLIYPTKLASESTTVFDSITSPNQILNLFAALSDSFMEAYYDIHPGA